MTTPAIQALELDLLLVSEPFADDDGMGSENAVHVLMMRRPEKHSIHTRPGCSLSDGCWDRTVIRPVHSRFSTNNIGLGTRILHILKHVRSVANRVGGVAEVLSAGDCPRGRNIRIWIDQRARKACSWRVAMRQCSRTALTVLSVLGPSSAAHAGFGVP